MKIGIVGGRDFKDYKFLKNYLQQFIVENEVNLSSVISGGAVGTDTLAEKFAAEMEVEIIIFKPDFAKYGRAATLVRNTQIIECSDTIFAFWDGKSKGTLDSIKKAKIHGKKLLISNY